MGTLSDSSIKTRAGSGSLELTYTSLPDTGIVVFDLGGISIDYDLDENNESASNVFFSPGKFKFSCFDKMNNGDSLFETLDAIPSTETIDVLLSFTTDGGYSWNDDYYFSSSDVKYDRESRTVTIEATFNIASNILVRDIFTAYPAEPRDANDFTGDIIKAYDFIDYYFTTLDSSATIINDSASYRDSVKTDGQESWLITNYGPTVGVEKSASEVIYELAAIDGSFVGLILGYAFFINRLGIPSAPLSPVSVSEDDVEELNIDIGINNYRRITLSYIEADYELLGAATIPHNYMAYLQDEDNSNLNPEGTNELSIYFFAPNISRGYWDGTNNEFGQELLVNTYALDTEYGEGAQEITLTDATGISVGDHLCFSLAGANPPFYEGDETYKIIAISGTTLTLDRPTHRDLVAKDLGNVTFNQRIIVTADPILSYNGFSHAIDCYKKAYGATGSNIIDITFHDIDSLKPHETFKLDSSFPGSVNLLTYRPSKMEYNLQTDKIKVEAYQIE